HSVSAVNGSAAKVGADVDGKCGVLGMSVDGRCTYTLDNLKSAVQALAEGQSVTDVFSYTNADNHGGTSTANLTITVKGTNDAPLAVADAASVKEDTNTLAQPNPVAGNVLSNDTDVDTTDTHSVSAVNGSTAKVGAD